MYSKFLQLRKITIKEQIKYVLSSLLDKCEKVLVPKTLVLFLQTYLFLQDSVIQTNTN